MNKKASLTIILFFALTLSAFCIQPPKKSKTILIPQPKEITISADFFDFREQAISLSPTPSTKKELHRLALFLSDQLYRQTNLTIKEKRGGNIHLILRADTTIRPEGYKLQIHPSGVKLEASNPAGIFYGIQTLLQLTQENGQIICADIQDSPRFSYRGLHLDVSRHFMNTDYTKRMIDLMATYKYNYFHWHLTDGGGWRMESKKYPKLTELAQARMESNWDQWWIKGDRRFVPTGTPGSYGGFYTQEEIREIVKYAADRYITIIPEIELPGHSNEVFAAYPTLNCRGEWAYDVSDFCIGNPETFTFLENILDETMELFPSPYIHIGGDEAEKIHWKDCPKCQALMQREGLKNVDELQSYTIKRIEKFINSRGRKIIGWDEILEGGLPPNATVMSWRGEDGGKAAVRLGNPAIMTPGKPLYFNRYQDNPTVEPQANGGYNPLRSVYDYNPLPSDLSPAEQSLILGAQGNLWTEYVPNESHAEYMIWPRALALAEILWTPIEGKHYDDFLRRVNIHKDKLMASGINVFPLKNIDLRIKVDTLQQAIRIYPETGLHPTTLRYTLDGSEPTAQSARYDSVILVKDSALLVIGHFKEGKLLYKPISFPLDYHKAIGKKVRYNCRYHRSYPAGGSTALTDGYRGSWTYLDKKWQGFTETMDITVDLGKVQPIKSIQAKFMQDKPSWVYMPEEVEVWISTDDQNYVSLGKIPTKTDITDTELRFETFRFSSNEAARYIRMKATQSQIKNYFLFTDEIIVH